MKKLIAAICFTLAAAPLALAQDKATARIIEQTQIETPEIKSVGKKQRDQTAMVNERG
jgi:Ni/Co efflux regulator RcnB